MREEGTDIGALSGAIIAVVVAAYLVADSYNLMDVAVAVTLTCLIGSFVWRKSRTAWFDSLPVAMVLGLVLIPILGFCAEIYLATTACIDRTKENGGDACWDGVRHLVKYGSEHSQVPVTFEAGCWAVLSAGIFIIDRRRQNQRMKHGQVSQIAAGSHADAES
jgi:hypothetical protein